MKETTELKERVLTADDKKLIEKSLIEWTESMFNPDESEGGICTYLLRNEIGIGVFKGQQRLVGFFTENGDCGIIDADEIEQIVDSSHGYSELITKHGGHCIYCGGIKVPLDLKADLDLVFNDPTQISHLTNHELLNYYKAFKFVGYNSIVDRRIKIQRQVQRFNMESDQFVKSVRTMDEKYQSSSNGEAE